MTASRPTIGLLSNNLTYSDQLELWAAVDSAARMRDVDLICYPGNVLGDRLYYAYQANVLYDLPSAESLDGLVIWGASIAFSFEEIKPFCERYRPLPMVNLSSPVKGIPTVLGGDNYQGTGDAVVHLLQKHGCRRIAFIKGSENNSEAKERYRAYTDALARHGLPLDPGLVAPGIFTRASGEEAIRLLLDERRVSFDAVVCVDDLTALGAMEVLRERGISVPKDVAVIGFDDIEEAQYATPPLTTVRQSFYEMGAAGDGNGTGIAG